MALSSTTHTGQSGIQTYLIGFPYLKAAYLRVSVDGSEITTWALSQDRLSVVILTPDMEGGEAIRIWRVTDISDEGRIVDFETSAALTEGQLDTAHLQTLHGLQELSEASEGGEHAGDATLHLPPGAHGALLSWDAGPLPLVISPGTSGYVLTSQGAGALPVWAQAPGSSGGEANTGSNVGDAGVGVFDAKVLVDLQFRTINSPSGAGIAVTHATAGKRVDLALTSTGVTTEGAPTGPDLLFGFVGGALRTFAISTLPTGSSLPVPDSTALVHSAIDTTRRVRISATNVAAGQTRVLTMPNANVDLTANTGSFPAAVHGSRHQLGGADVIAVDTLGAPTDITQHNATTLAHGFLRKLSGTSTTFMDGTGQWSTPAGAGVTGAQNVGGGVGLFAGLTGTTLDFRSLVAGSGISITSNATTATISTTGGGGDITDGSNVNVGGVGVFDGKVGTTLTFRGVAPASGGGLAVTLDDGNNLVNVGIAAGGVQLSHLLNFTGWSLLGNPTTTAGPPTIITANLLTSVGPDASTELLGFEGALSSSPMRRYDVGTLPISNWIGNTNLADMAANTLKGRGNSGTGDPIDIDFNDLAEDATPAAGDFVIGWNSSNVLVRYNIGNLPTAGGGEANTGANVSTDGIGVFDGKVGLQLQFRGVAALAGGGLAVTLDDTQNDIDLSIASLGITTGHLAAAAVTYAKIQTVSEARILGRAAGAGAGTTTELTATQLEAITSITFARQREALFFARASVLEFGATTQPGSPSVGDAYVTGATIATGATWVANRVVEWTGAAWDQYPFTNGMRLRVASTATHHFKGATLAYHSGEALWYPMEELWIGTEHWTGAYFPGTTEKIMCKAFNGVLDSGGDLVTTITHGATLDTTFPRGAYGFAAPSGSGSGVWIPQDFSSSLIYVTVNNAAILINGTTTTQGYLYTVRFLYAT